MPKKGKRKAKKKQWRDILPWIAPLATAFYWVVKTILLVIEWWLTH